MVLDLRGKFTSRVRYSNSDDAYQAIIDNLGEDSCFIKAKLALEYAYNDLTGEKLNHIMCWVSFAENDLKQASAAGEFLDLCKNHPNSDGISGFALSSPLHCASKIRNAGLVEKLLSFPNSKDIGLQSLESASIYAMASGNPEIMRIEPRGVDYDFAGGAPDVLALFTEHKNKYHSAQKPQPKAPQ